MSRIAARLAPVFLLVCSALGQQFHTYVGQLGPDFVLLAWGTTTGVNTIGRSSRSHGEATVRVGAHTVETRENWALVSGLTPDTTYPYEVTIGKSRIGSGQVRTWADRSDRLVFLVIGDYGTGGSGQRRIASVMAEEIRRRRDTADPVRFVITTGDNIYADMTFGVYRRNTGSADRHWRSKFFEPYRTVIDTVPFMPSLGNHDGNESEFYGDLPAYLDNFFFPGLDPKGARYYRFAYGEFVDFFALDSTRNTFSGSLQPMYDRDGEQFRWLVPEIKSSRTPWKIAYFHHPPFTAGPNHLPSFVGLEHFVRLFRESGVQVVFNGHEHNFQFAGLTEETGRTRYIISGAGGELRTGNTIRSMEVSGIEGWSPQRHFLVVSIEGKTMTVTPVGYQPVRVVDASGEPIRMPLRIEQ